MPVSIVLLIYQAIALPFVLWTLWRLLAPVAAVGPLWQFDLKAVLWFMGMLAVSLSVGRLTSDQGGSNLTAIAVGLLVGAVAALALMAYRAQAPRASLRLAQAADSMD